MNFKIEQEFKDLIPPLSVQEYETLEQSIIEEGCREPLIIWAGENVLLDGHNRYKICLENKLPYKTITKEFNGEDDAKRWVLMNQLGRRNLNPDALSLLRGALYNLIDKHPGKRNDISTSGKNCTRSSAKELAEKTGVSERTIKNDGKFEDAVNKIKDKIDKGFKNKVQDPEIKTPPKKTIINAAAVIVDDNPGTFLQAKSILEDKKPGIAAALGDNQHELICAAAMDCIIRLNRADKGSDYEKATEKDFKLMSEALAKVDEKLLDLNKKIGEVYHKKFKAEVKK